MKTLLSVNIAESQKGEALLAVGCQL